MICNDRPPLYLQPLIWKVQILPLKAKALADGL